MSGSVGLFWGLGLGQGVTWLCRLYSSADVGVEKGLVWGL